MSDQVVTSAQVTDEASPQIQAIREAWLSLVEALGNVQEEAAATGGSLTELGAAGAESSTSIAEQVGALKEQVAVLEQSNTALQEEIASLQESVTATREANTAEQELLATRKEQLEAASDMIDGNTRFMAGLGDMGLAAVVALEAVSKLSEGIQQLSEAGMEGEQADARLTATLNANVGGIGEYEGALQRAKDQATQFGITNSTVENSLARILPIVPNVSEDLRILSDAENVSAATGKDLETSMVAISRAIETGSVSALTRMGIVLTDSTGKVLTHASATEILTAVEQKYGQAAAEMADTGAGAAVHLNTAQKNLNETVGTDFVDAAAKGNAAQAAIIDRWDEAAKSGNKFADVSGYLNSILLGYPAHVDATIESFFHFGAVEDAATKSTQDVGAAADGTDASVKNLGVDAAGAVGPLSDLDQKAVEAGKSLDSMNTVVNQSADDAKAATAAYTLATSQGLQGAVDETKSKMAALARELDITEKAMDAAIQSGDAHKQGLLEELEKELTASQTDMQSELDVLNSLVGPAGQAGYNAGHAWAVNYDAQIAQGLANAQNAGAQNPDESSHVLAGTGAGSNYRDLSNADPATVAANRAAIRHADDAALITGGYKDPPKGPKGGSAANKAITAEKRDDKVGQDESALKSMESEEQLRQEKAKLTDAQTNLTKVTNDWNATIKTEQDLINGGQAEQQWADKYGALAQSIKQVSTTLHTEQEEHAASQHATQVEIHDTQAALDALKQSDANALKPLIDDAKQAQTALDNLRSAAKDADNQFVVDEHPVQEALQADAAAAQALSDKMRDVQDAENAAMKVMQATTDAASKAVEDETEKLDKLNDGYANKLFPIQQQLAALQNAQSAQGRAKSLEDEKQQVINLTDQLSNLTVGSDAYNEMLKQRNDLQTKLGQDTQIDKLTGQQQSIQAQQAQQDHLEQQKLKALQATQKADQEAQAAAQKMYEDQKAILAAQQEAEAKQTESDQKQLQAIQDKKAEFDYEEQQKEFYAQKDVDRANAAVKAAQDEDTAREKALTDELAGLQTKLANEQWADGQEEWLLGQTLQRFNDEKTKRDDNYSEWKDTEDAKLAKMQTDATSAETTAKNNVSALQAIYNNDQNDKGNQDFVDKVSKAINTLKTDSETAKQPIDDLQGYMSLLSQASGDAATHLGGTNDTGTLNKALASTGDPTSGTAVAAANSTKSFADALNNNLKPAVGDMQSNVLPALDGVWNTWMTYFGQPNEIASGDLTHSIGWFMNNHNATGFWGAIMADAVIALGDQGLKGLWDGALEVLSTDLQGRMAELASAMGIAGTAAADSFASSFKTELTAKMAFSVTVSADGGGNNNPPATTPPVTIPGKATGGDVSANTAYIVGEKGPELFVPGKSGAIVPNNQLGGSGGAGGSGAQVTITVQNTFQVAGDALLKYGKDSNFWDQFSEPMSQSLKRNEVWKGAVVV